MKSNGTCLTADQTTTNFALSNLLLSSEINHSRRGGDPFLEKKLFLLDFSLGHWEPPVSYISCSSHIPATTIQSQGDPDDSNPTSFRLLVEQLPLQHDSYVYME